MNCFRCLLATAIVLSATNLAPAQETSPGQLPKAAKPDRAALEKSFERSLSNVTLVGHFTDDAKKSDTLSEERYTIYKVTKAQGDYWIFLVRIQYGKRDIKVPLPLRVQWAGDTPVITVTDVAIPGIGTYTARVVIYRGKYAGTWSGKDHGGHLMGKIVKNEAKKKK